MSQTQTGPKIVKRYANRKLYDTEESKYVTLKDIAGVILSGRQVQVVDNRTKTDITGQTLLQALVETEVEAANHPDALHSIIRAGGLTKFVAGVLTATKPTVG
jgi:polyhydroxyalkanoate synthesis repressor PhaR